MNNKQVYESQQDIKECTLCRKQFDKLKRCTGCLCTFYCSVECQKKDWSNHKMESKKLREGKNTENVQDLVKKIHERMNFIEKQEKDGNQRDPITGIRLYPPMRSPAPSIMNNGNTSKTVLINVSDRMIYKDPKFKILMSGKEEKIIKRIEQGYEAEDLPALLNMVFDKRLFESNLQRESNAGLYAIDAILGIITNPKKINEVKEKYHDQILDFVERWMTVDEVEDCDYAGIAIYRLILDKMSHVTENDDWSYLTNILVEFATDENRSDQAKKSVFDIIEKIAPISMYPQICDRLALLIKDPAVIWRDPFLVACTVFVLCHFGSVKHLPLIRNAFEKNCVQLNIFGGYCIALAELGLPIDMNDPVVQKYYKRDKRELDVIQDRMRKEKELGRELNREERGYPNFN
jgi:hypothetical protein